MNSIIDFEAETLGILGNIVPLSVTISCAEPRHMRISTTIGAKKRYFCFFDVIQKGKKTIQQSLTITKPTKFKTKIYANPYNPRHLCTIKQCGIKIHTNFFKK